jgi:heptosyltransferase-2
MQAAVPGAHVLEDLDLGSYAAVMSGAKFILANDSGPMHLAAAIDAPVIGIFGRGNPKRTGPWGLRTRIVGSARAWPELVTVRSSLVAYMQ